MLCLIVILQLDDQYLSDNRKKKKETLDNYLYIDLARAKSEAPIDKFII